MAYDVNKKVKLSALKALAQKSETTYAKKTDVTALQTNLQNLDAAALRGVKVNGTALAIAEKMVDILIATGSADGTIAVNGVDVVVKGLAALAFKAEVSEAELSAALKAVIDAKAEQTAVDTLNTALTALVGEDTGKSARTIANEELAKQLIPENAKESLDTLVEIAEWIQNHPEDASAMNKAIVDLAALVGTIPEDAEAKTVVAYIVEYTDKQLQAMNQTVANKADKVAGAAEGNLAGLDANGNLTDSGIAAGKVLTEDDVATDAEVAEMLNEIYPADAEA